jgi:hypothetical protein
MAALLVSARKATSPKKPPELRKAGLSEFKGLTPFVGAQRAAPLQNMPFTSRDPKEPEKQAK